MVEQVERDYEQAMAEPMESIDKAALSSIPDQLARFKTAEPTQPSQEMDSPNIT